MGGGGGLMQRMDYSKTVVVTGGSGFIGSHLVVHLVNTHPDWRIINLDNLDYCCSPRSLECVEERANYTFIRGDVCNPRVVQHLFNCNNVDIIFHLAAKTHVESSFQTPSSFQRVNIEGTRVLLKEAHQVHQDRHRLQRFIYVSTDEVYGAWSDPGLDQLGLDQVGLDQVGLDQLGPDQVFDESSPMRPSNPYSESKAAAEDLVYSYWTRYKFPVLITRSNNVYGPRQFTEKVIPRFVTQLQKNQKCTIQGTLPKSRHFLFVDDVVDAFLLLLEKGSTGQVYNVGTSCEIPIMQLARELIKMVKKVPDSELNDWMEFVPDRPQVDLRYPITCQKLQQLGWRPQVSWTEGIHQTVKWYQDNPNFWSDPGEPSLLV
ncbi:dTDP-D-glucose 4,6-dehydratase [Sphaeramia orbicularis]|uniref:NAD-dependent epimerase/dehydratase domain-containing protein n=1 Tax=Sphaeramia orbicularis TaxID=375764 RepID=A0A673BSA2_9TELE|nr:dTDP-D-glucose 4,6-dehydratase [Sphaeramia orbicularis]